MHIADYNKMRASGSLFCPKCGYGLLGFIKASDGKYAWCPNCERDNGSGGALSGAVDGVHDDEVIMDLDASKPR